MFARLTVAAIGVTAVAVMTTSTSRAQSDGFPQGGPRDWSHGRLIGSSFGRDGDRNIDSNWRTHAKRVRLQRMLERRGLQDQLDILDLLRRGGRPKPRPVQDESESHLDWNLRTGGFGDVLGSPAKYSFDITAFNCSDVMYFTVDQSGAAARPNVIAITNAYASCPGNAAGTTPTVKWGIRMPNGTATSAVPSLDGTVLYVLENANPVILHAINVNNITTNPGTYNFGTTNWSNAHTLSTSPIGTPTSEQLFQITFPAGVTNNVSSPWLDYTGNQLFFGDSTGRIQHVINTHLSTASRDTTNFTNQCGTNQLTSPVFIYGQVIVTSYNGYLYRLDTAGTSPYTCIRSSQIGGGTANGIAGSVSSPIVDVGNDQIIVSTNNGSGVTSAGIATFAVMFASNAVYTSAASLGPETTQAPVNGTFDDAYWSNGTGNYYVVGANAANTNTYVYKFPYNGSLGAAAGFVQLHRSGASAVVATSPVTEFLSTGTPNKDEVYVSGGGGTYLFMNRVLAGFAGSDASPVSMANWFATPGGGAVSTIIIDTNTAAVTGGTATANIYYGTKAVGPSTTQSTIVQLAQQF
jgi:hypothetical protein